MTGRRVIRQGDLLELRVASGHGPNAGEWDVLLWLPSEARSWIVGEPPR